MSENNIQHPDIIPGLSKEGKIQTITKDSVLKEVSALYNLTVTDLYRKTREDKFVEPRHIVMSILKYALDYRNYDISLEFGNTSATIVHARLNVMNFYKTDKRYRERIDSLLERLFSYPEDRKSVLDMMMDPEMHKYKRCGVKDKKVKVLTTV